MFKPRLIRPIHESTPTETITWTGAVVLMFAAIVPNAPSKMLVAGLLAVSMNPLAMLVARARGTWNFGPASNVIVMHYPDFLLVGVAVVISRVVTKLWPTSRQGSVTEGGVFYYVMELLDGIDLETLVKTFGPQPAPRVVSILRQVCGSLSDAHHHGMIHRDIKPSNIFLCRMGNEYDFAKVLDFGLVKVLDDNELGLTGEGATTGTPAYMAPEVSLGNAVDGRTDLYAIGCVAYWLTTGHLVFEEKGATAIMLAHVRNTPIPPSERSELHVPEWLDRIILMCLAKDPSKRPASAETLTQMLEGGNGAGSWTVKNAEDWWLTNIPENAVPMDTAAEEPRRRYAGDTTI